MNGVTGEVSWVLLLLPLLLSGHHFFPRLPRIVQLSWIGVSVTLSIFLLGNGVHSVVTAYRSKREWDFLVFWLYGRAPLLGIDPYEPNAFFRIDLPFSVPESWRHEVLKSTMVYPPHSLLLFSLFGMLPYGKAFLAWNLSIAMAFLLSVPLLASVILRDTSLQGLLLTLCLCLLLRASQSTFWFSQSNFFILLLLLLYLWKRSRFSGGFFLGLSSLIKPYPTLLTLFPLIRRNWRPLAGVAAAGGLLFTATTFVWGAELYGRYLSGDFLRSLPWDNHVQGNNHSIARLLAKLTGLNPEEGLPSAQPLFLLTSAVILGVTLTRIHRRSSEDDLHGFSALLFAVLLIYPSSLEHYHVMALIPLLLIWGERDFYACGPLISGGLITLSYALSAYHDGKFTFVANGILWFASLSGIPRRKQSSLP